MNILMVLLTKEYALLKPGQGGDQAGGDENVWHIEEGELIQIFMEVCCCLSNLMIDPYFAARASNSYDLARLMKELMDKYILNDFFEVDRRVQEKKIEEFQRVV